MRQAAIVGDLIQSLSGNNAAAANNGIFLETEVRSQTTRKIRGIAGRHGTTHGRSSTRRVFELRVSGKLETERRSQTTRKKIGMCGWMWGNGLPLGEQPAKSKNSIKNNQKMQKK